MLILTDMRISVVLIAGLCLIQPVYAKNTKGPLRELSFINIQLSGTVIASACRVEPSDQNKSVDLGSWQTKKLASSGKTDLMPFSIRLTGCTNSGVSVAFTGNKDKNIPELLALDEDSTASGVAIEIVDSSKSRLPVGSDSQKVATDAKGDALLNFSARYVATGKPEAGTANAITEFTITYD